MYENINLFREIKPENIPGMLECIGAYQRQYDKNSFIMYAGDEISCIGVVLSGSINILKEDGLGHLHIKSSIGKNETFSESVVCAGIKITPVSVIATSDTTVLYLPFAKILITCASSCSFHTRLIYNLVAVLAEKNIYLDKINDYLGAKSVRAKIARYLLDCYDKNNGNKIKVPFNRSDLAGFLGTDRSVLSREISAMKKEGILDFDKNTFFILDLPTMTDLSI